MTRDTLLSELRELAIAAGWTGQDLGHLRGRWAREATLEQLQACRDRLFDASAHEVVEWDDDACHVPAALCVWDGHDWVADLFMPRDLTTFPVLPETAADVVAEMRQVAVADSQKRLRRIVQAETGIRLTRERLVA